MTEYRAGRFSSAERHATEEEFIRLVSVGVDIGSSTSHLIFSRLILQLKDQRYVTVGRRVLHQSDILLTPYLDGSTIDGEALRRFIEAQYEEAGLQRDDVDTGALILTGVALLRNNARAIADIFAAEAGRFVSVGAGDNLESIMAAHGSGAMDLSGSNRQAIMNVDVGGGTTKLTLCVKGKAEAVAAINVGARLVALDRSGTIVRLEDTGREIGAALGLDLRLGRALAQDEMRSMAGYMADRLLEHMTRQPLSDGARALLRTPPLDYAGRLDGYVFSGGVAEFIYGRESQDFGDLGAHLGRAVRERVEEAGLPLLEARAGIRATVIGASQYTVQVSGSTIFIEPAEAVPVRNVPVISPAIDMSLATLDQAAIGREVAAALARFDLAAGESAVAVALRWAGSATWQRLDSVAGGIVEGLRPVLDRGHPLVVVYDNDIGGLLGLHLKEEMGLPNPVISIDRVELKEFDFIDIGALIPSTGAVPVIVKTLVFPSAAEQRSS